MTTSSPASRRILLAEDNYLIATTIRQHIENSGSQVVGPMGSLREVMAALEGHSEIDGAVLDINLNGEMVFPAADRLRHRGIPFMFATSYEPHMLPERFRSNQHMLKPLDEQDLRRGLHAMLGGSHARRNDPAEPLRGKRIFLIEDDDALYLEIRKNLQRAGASVWGCPAHFPEMPHMVPASAFDAALVDVDKQDRTIIPVVAELKRREIPALLLCSWDASKVGSLMRNARRFMLKPVGHAELVAALVEVGQPAASTSREASTAGQSHRTDTAANEAVEHKPYSIGRPPVTGSTAPDM